MLQFGKVCQKLDVKKMATALHRVENEEILLLWVGKTKDKMWSGPKLINRQYTLG